MRETKVQSSVIRRTGDGNAAVEVVITDDVEEADQAFFLHVRVSLADLDKTPMRAIVARALAEAAKTAAYPRDRQTQAPSASRRSSR